LTQRIEHGTKYIELSERRHVMLAEFIFLNMYSGS